MATSGSFDELSYEAFRKLAQDKSISKYERIGFPDSYRAEYEDAIFADIRKKLTNLDSLEQKVIDIGPGCSDLPCKLISLCSEKQHELILIDNKEMLDYLPDEPFVNKVDALYPNCPELISKFQGTINVILTYSVLHYILVDVAFFRFLDLSLSLLAPGGQFMIGDIPNISKRKRFFSSETGVQFHKNHMETEERPKVDFNKIENDQIDDSIVFAILQRARSAGFDAYVVPQELGLPLSNRREDILIVRP